MPFSTWTNGSVEIYFQHYKKKPPMDHEAYKLQLVERLNKIPGVEITKDQINARPSFDLLLLKGNNLNLFFEAFEWFNAHFTQYQVAD